MGEGRQRIEVNWVQGIAGALAAVTSAVLLSTVGVVGTLVGAALGSVATTLGSAVYSYYLALTKERVAARAAAAARVGQARSQVEEASEDLRRGTPGAGDELAHAGEDLGRAQTMLEDAEEEPPGVGWRAVLRALPWRWIALSATAVFVLAMTAILAFELVTGRAVSSYTGGSDTDRRTTIPGLGGGSGLDEPRRAPEQTPVDGASGEPDEDRPAGEPTQAPTVTEESGASPFAEETSDTSTAEPTPTPTPTPTSRSTPSAPATPAPSP